MTVAGYSSLVRHRVFLLVLITAAAGLVLTLTTTPPSATATQQSTASGNSASVESSNANDPVGDQSSGDAQAIAYINAQGAGTVAEIAAGGDHTCARTTGGAQGGAVFCWGDNEWGQLGTGQTEVPAESDVPLRVVGGAQPNDFLSDALEISAGYDHTCVRTGNGTAFCWGANSFGELGSGVNQDDGEAEPTQVRGLSDVKQISAGSYFTCALNGDATYCWGDNYKGKLGNGDLSASASPQQVLTGEQGAEGGFLTGATQVSAGGEHACAVVGVAAFCWGDNDYGQLGNDSGGDGNDSSVPVQVAGVDGSGTLANVKQVSAGEIHSCATTTNGAAFCWGDNDDGQLGIETEAERTDRFPGGVCNPRCGSKVPAQVLGGAQGDGKYLSNVDHISSGSYFSCAVASGGTNAYCWGDNDYGQLGNGVRYEDDDWIELTPVAVDAGQQGFSNATQISAGVVFTTCAVTGVGGAYCWGENDFGNLGDGSTKDSTVPVAVAGQLRVQPADVDFKSVDVGKSKSKDVTVKSAFPLTNEPVVVDIQEIEGSRKGFDFTPDSGCAKSADELTLVNGQDCEGAVKFAPKTPGEFGGIVSLTPQAYPNAGTEFAASGYAAPGPNPGGAVVKAGSGDFGKVDVFTAKVEKIKIKNTGDEPLRVSGFKIKNDADDEFAANVKDCAKDQVAPGGSCTAKVQFFPRAEGESVALLDLKSNAIGSDTIALFGEGVVPVQETDADGNPIGPNKVRKLTVPEKTLTAKEATARWKRPSGDVTVTEYQTRIKKKNGNWKGWSNKDPEPNLKGWINRTFKKLSANTNYKVQVRALSYEVPGKKSAVNFTTDRNGIPTRPANG